MRAVVGQYFHPARFRFTDHAPARGVPITLVHRHCVLHSGMRSRSETTAQTRSGGAAMSMLAWRSFGMPKE